MIEYVEDTLGRCRRLLRDGNDAAHGIEARIETADVGQKREQHADGNFIVRHQPDAERPHHQQPDFGQQRDAGREQRPDFVDAVIDLQVVLVGGAEAFRFAPFLGERLDHADAGDSVGQYVAHFRPDSINFFKAGAQAVAHVVDHPGDEGQRQQGGQRQPGVDGKKDRCRHRNHQHIRRKIKQMQ